MKNDLPGYLFHQGTNFNAYDYLGAHFCTAGDKNGVIFRVWAPNAKSVSVVGDFNDWDKTSSVMQKVTVGVYELFVEGVKEYDNYKYAITSNNGEIVLKADPYAFHSETPPNTASKVYDIEGFEWTDGEYLEFIKTKNHLKSPMNVYEVNLASWKRRDKGEYLTYEDLERELVPYVKKMGYTHVEFMPVSEYPFDGSWGYQVVGYYSITSRFGTPKQFMSLINAFHREGIGVIVDWVPAHFPKDEHGLIEFDGAPLYEYQGKDRQENEVWGTRYFDVGRTEVQSFLISNAVFFFEKFHVDGLRVDAVAAMLYLDYDKRPGEWVPNQYGENKNLEAIAFFHKLNKEIFGRYPYALMIAEESTANIKVTGPVHEGGLGFNFKWNMGWMNDTLSYMSTDPLFRSYHHNKLTFSLTYAFSENYILPISHDEVVHGKKSVLDRMPGFYEDKFAGNRAFMGYMMAHPGKKLTFMGEEFGQFKEWDYKEGLEYFLLNYPLHYKLWVFYKEINEFYKNTPALYKVDDKWDGFRWIDADLKDKNLYSFIRNDGKGNELIAVINMSGCDNNDYFIKLPEGKYKVSFNSDMIRYGGSGKIKKQIYIAKKSKNKETGITLKMPKLSFIYLEKLS
ncbi:MAG: 1,4-alpha-glucan branching protein GlgB [Clostridiales bacterium]|nr:1,4-alpha-glucan branching protein GlgB [Clostridiales bacterium]